MKYHTVAKKFPKRMCLTFVEKSNSKPMIAFAQEGIMLLVWTKMIAIASNYGPTKQKKQ